MARALDRLEETLERVMKESFTRSLGGRLHPVEIASKLTKAMDSNQTITAQRVLVPNVYTVRLSPADMSALEPLRTTLERELASYLAQAIEEGGFSTVAYPRVDLQASQDMAPRRVQVQARIVEGTGAAPPDPQEGHTVRLETLAAGLAGKAWLVSPAAAGQENAQPLTNFPFSLGRGLDNDLVLEPKGVSRHHAQVRVLQGRPCLLDLGSTNGTYLNGRRITEAFLKDGDVITLGPVRLLFRWGE